jgi:hypothetical protein
MIYLKFSENFGEKLVEGEYETFEHAGIAATLFIFNRRLSVRISAGTPTIPTMV